MSAVKNKPATPLPWVKEKTQPAVVGPAIGGSHLVKVANFVGHIAEPNSAYATHAANAYPKLVEALRELTGRIADAEQWNPAMKPEQFRLALGTVQGATQFTAATALLRELGEES